MSKDVDSRIILDLCGGTGAWSKPYKDAGYDVRLVTLPAKDLLDETVVNECISAKPYGILFAVECTPWCAAAARWWKSTWCLDAQLKIWMGNAVKSSKGPWGTKAT